MATVRLPHPDDAPEEVRQFILASQERFHTSFPPVMSCVLAGVPELMPAYQDMSKWVYGPGKVSRARKEMIATCVAAMNACHY